MSCSISFTFSFIIPIALISLDWVMVSACLEFLWDAENQLWTGLRPPELTDFIRLKSFYFLVIKINWGEIKF